MKRFILLTLGLLGATAFALSPASAQDALRLRRAFPHAKHAKLFPTCTACHAGATNGNPRQMMPAPASCVQCHNGTDAKRVNYDAPAAPHDFLRFSHAEHAAKVPKEGRECTVCHGAMAAAPTMEVAHVTPASCLTCHAHQATDHLAMDS